MSITPLQRLLPPAYEDGFTLPRKSESGNDLPSARLVSITTRSTRPALDPNFTSLLVAFGQFLDHDLDLVPVQSKYLPHTVTDLNSFIAFGNVNLRLPNLNIYI